MKIYDNKVKQRKALAIEELLAMVDAYKEINDELRQKAIAFSNECQELAMENEYLTKENQRLSEELAKPPFKQRIKNLWNHLAKI